MKIALIGYGKMGKELEKAALSRGHEIVCIIDIRSVTTISCDCKQIFRIHIYTQFLYFILEPTIRECIS